MARGKFSGQYVVIETTHGFHSVVRTWLRLRCFHKSRDWDGLPPGPLVNGHFANWSSVQCTFSSPQALGWILRGKVGLPTNFFSYTSWHRSKLTGFILSYFWKLFHKNFPFFKTDGFPKHYIAHKTAKVYFFGNFGRYRSRLWSKRSSRWSCAQLLGIQVGFWWQMWAGKQHDWWEGLMGALSWVAGGGQTVVFD